MKKTISITIGGQLFNIEEDAFERLDSYLESIKSHYKDQSGDEIIGDIEASIAEKFASKIKDKNTSVSLDDVEEMIKVMGTVDEFDSESKDQENKTGASRIEEEQTSIPKKLYRDTDDTIIAGVCSGIAAYFGLDAVYIRVLFVILVFLHGFGILAYIILWIVMPSAKTNAQKLEMRGKPVNLQKLEETIKEKSADIAEGIKKNGNQKLKKFLAFPVQIVKQIFLILKKIILTVGPFLSVIIGLGIVISLLFAVAGLTFAGGVLFFNINSPYLISDISLHELAANRSYYAAVISAYLTILIPIIFIMLTGLVMIRRKNSFNLIFSFVLIGLWIASVVGLGLSAVDLAPKVNEQINKYKQTESVIKQYEYAGINSYRIGTIGNVSVKKGDVFKIEAKGSQNVLDNLVFENKDGELNIYQKNEHKGICVFCLDKQVDITIIAPELKSFIAFNRVKADISGFEDQDLKINAGESAQVSAQVSGGKITSYIAGVNGLVKLNGSPNFLDATLEGSGELRAHDLRAEEVKLTQSVFSDSSLGGEAKKLTAKLSNDVEMKAFNLKADEVYAELSGLSRAEVFPINKLLVKLSGESYLYYANEPKEINKQIYDSGRMKKVDNWETFSDENDETNATAYRDSDGNLSIVFSNDTYSPTMSSVRGIELKPEAYISGHDIVNFRWQTDNGYLVDDWSKPEYVKKIDSQDGSVSWTFMENEEFVKNKYPIHVYLEAVDESGIALNEAKLELEWIGDGIVKVKK